MNSDQQVVGGGIKKVLYTLNTVRKIGVKRSAKALQAKNTCKACGLGMGGQRGGMTNEKDEFPSVCNKSIQAQLSDIQGPIPEEIFKHTLDELRELSARELETLGRLGSPIYKSKLSNRFIPISWDDAISKAVTGLSNSTPDRTFFYTSGRSSNEAAFVLQLLARMYGCNNVNNCSYYCHQATSEGLSTTIGTGTATVELNDLSLCDLIFVIGANPASNHPRFIHQLKNCRDRGGNVIVINPAKEAGLVKFAVPKSPTSLIIGGHQIASKYLQPAIGTDIALFKGIAKAVIELGQTDTTFIDSCTSGFSDYLNDIKQTSWHDIVTLCGIEKDCIESVAACYARANKAVFAWGMGMTHHTHGVENVEAIANLAMLRGMLGKPGVGLLPLRGHSNVQGIGTVGVKPVLAEDIFKKIEDEFNISVSRAKGMDTLSCLQAASEGNIDAAIVMGGNLYAASPGAEWTRQALDNIDCKVFLTTTLNSGHIYGCDNSESLILPVTARDEEWQPTTQESMFNYVRFSDGGITRLDNVRPEINILSDIADSLLVSAPFKFAEFKQHQKVRQAIAQIVPGMQALKDIDTTRQEFHIDGRIKHTPTFSLPQNRAKFIVNPLSNLLKSRQQHQQSDSSDLDFTLMTVRSEGQFNSIIYEEHDSYRNIPHRWSVLMNPADMRKLGLDNEDTITLQTQYGTMENVSVFRFDLPAQCLMAYYPEANILLGQQADPRSRTPAFKSVAVTVVV